jgi:hypothetical protein
MAAPRSRFRKGAAILRPVFPYKWGIRPVPAPSWQRREMTERGKMIQTRKPQTFAEGFYRFYAGRGWRNSKSDTVVY